MQIHSYATIEKVKSNMHAEMGKSPRCTMLLRFSDAFLHILAYLKSRPSQNPLFQEVALLPVQQDTRLRSVEWLSAAGMKSPETTV